MAMEVDPKEIKVKKYLGLSLLPHLKWRRLAFFST
jgi:hypothetical protein